MAGPQAGNARFGATALSSAGVPPQIAVQLKWSLMTAAVWFDGRARATAEGIHASKCGLGGWPRPHYFLPPIRNPG